MKKFLISLLLFIQINSETFRVLENRVEFDLQFNSLENNIWEVFSENQSNQCTQQLKKTHNTQAINFTKECKQAKNTMIEQNCEINNLSYTVPLYFNLTTSTSFKSNSKPPLQLAIDLNTPWSWVREKDCKQCNRQGSNCQNGCILPLETNDSSKYRSIDCNNFSKTGCTKLQECGLIQTYSEGLSLQGQFADLYVRFGQDKNDRIKQYRMILVNQRVQNDGILNADGVLGLGYEFEDGFEDIQINKQYLNYMYDTGFVDSVLKTFDEVKIKNFSLKLGKDNPKLIIGEIDTTYAHNIEKHPLQYIQLPQYNKTQPKENLNDEFVYYKWQVEVSSIEISYIDKEIKDRITWQNRHVHNTFNDSQATISVSTSALVIPQGAIKFFTKVLDKIYGIQKCQVDVSKRNYIVCQDLKEELILENIMVFVTLEPKVVLHINPKDLVQGCRKINDKYECILNIQQSYTDDQIILGDVVLRNSYIDFDMENRQIGFTHRKTEYINNLMQKLEGLLIEVGEDIVTELAFVLRFYFVIFFLIIAFISLKHISDIIKYADKICLKYFNKHLVMENIETQRLTMNEMEMSVQKTDDDDYISQRKYDTELEALDQSGNLDDTNYDEI